MATKPAVASAESMHPTRPAGTSATLKQSVVDSRFEQGASNKIVVLSAAITTYITITINYYDY